MFACLLGCLPELRVYWWWSAKCIPSRTHWIWKQHWKAFRSSVQGVLVLSVRTLEWADCELRYLFKRQMAVDGLLTSKRSIVSQVGRPLKLGPVNRRLGFNFSWNCGDLHTWKHWSMVFSAQGNDNNRIERWPDWIYVIGLLVNKTVLITERMLVRYLWCSEHIKSYNGILGSLISCYLSEL